MLPFICHELQIEEKRWAKWVFLIFTWINTYVSEIHLLKLWLMQPFPVNTLTVRIHGWQVNALIIYLRGYHQYSLAHWIISVLHPMSMFPSYCHTSQNIRNRHKVVFIKIYETFLWLFFVVYFIILKFRVWNTRLPQMIEVGGKQTICISPVKTLDR